MTSPVGAIAPISSLSGLSATSSTTSASSATGGTDFSSALGKSLDAVSNAQSNADNLAVQAATGQDIDPAAVTTAATQATLMTQLATTVQSKAEAAFNTIMGMQA